MGLFDSIKKTLTSIADSSGITKLKEGLQKHVRYLLIDFSLFWGLEEPLMKLFCRR